MKKMIGISLVMVGLSTQCFASNWKETCSSVGELAQIIMEKRQDGVAMEALIDSVSKTEKPELAEELIISAYEKSQYNGEDYKRKAIAEFRDSAYLQCVKSMRKE